MAIDTKIRSVNDCFLRKQIKVDFEWLHGCVQFFLDEKPDVHIDELFREAEEQWELSDLADSGISCLPNSIFERKQAHTIDGVFAVQMQSILDISQAAYDQLQTIQDKVLDVGNENPEFFQPTQPTQKPAKPNLSSTKRVLRLELTDGHRTITAMEYRPISCLNTKLLPGTKLLIMGPLRCINGVLFLEAKSVRILGGEVSSKTIENAYENVLRRCLNQPLNPNPMTEYAETTIRETIPPNIPPSAQRTNEFDDFQDDDFLCDVDVDQIATIAITTSRNQSTEKAQQNRQPALETEILFDDDFDENDFHQIDSQLEEDHMHDNPGPTSARTISDEPSVAGRQQSSDDSRNEITIRQLNKCSLQDKLQRKRFVIRGEIDKIVEPAKVARDHYWRLGALLRDRSENISDSERIRVRFDSNLLEKLAGISGREVYAMNTLRSTQPTMVHEIKKILENLANRLTTIDAFVIEFTANANHPMVIDTAN